MNKQETEKKQRKQVDEPDNKNPLNSQNTNLIKNTDCDSVRSVRSV